MNKRSMGMKYMMLFLILASVPIVSCAAEPTAFEQMRELFRYSMSPGDPTPLHLGATLECTLTQFDGGGNVLFKQEKLRFVPVGSGTTMVINDVSSGDRMLVGAVWVNTAYGYESVDSYGYNCDPAHYHKTVNYYKRVLRFTGDGRIVIERMTSQEGACVGNFSDPLESRSTDMDYPQAIADAGYRARQYLICSLPDSPIHQ